MTGAHGRRVLRRNFELPNVPQLHTPVATDSAWCCSPWLREYLGALQRARSTSISNVGIAPFHQVSQL